MNKEEFKVEGVGLIVEGVTLLGAIFLSTWIS